MKTRNLSKTAVVLVSAGLMTFAAAPVQADVGDLVSDNDFTYEVLTENKSSRTGTVSVACFNQESRPEIIIPEVAHCLNYIDGETVQYTYNVVGIGRGIVAWYDVPVTRFFIPKTIQFIPEPPIGNMVEIKGVEVAEDNPWFCSPGGLLMDKEQTRLIYYPQNKEGSFYEIPSTVKTIGMNAFTWNETLTEINVPDTVTEIEFSAFGSCLNLEKIRLSAALKKLEPQMFWHCDYLKEVIIPEGIEEIGQGVFGLCMSLNKVEFPASVKSLGEELFLECTELEGVYFNGNAPEAENIFAFWDEEETTSKATVYYRKGTTGWGPTFCGRPTAVWGDEEPATISCKAEGNVLIINYTGTLYQSSDTVNWTEVAGATSPYKVTMSEHKLFFRTQGGVPIYQNMTIPLADDVDLDLIWIEPGTFVMGSPEDEIGRDGVEVQHTETIRYGFWLGKYEVTHEQYKAIMGENPSQFSGSGKPVETVSWYDAMSFCEKLTAREKEAGRLPAGYKYTLPTSAEWEYACRAGTTTAFNNGTNIPTEEQATEPCPNLDQVGWYDYNSNSAVHTVGQKKPNAWGLYDMHGNVNEWTSSKPEGREDEDLYIIRGGDWESWPYSCRSAYWHMQGPDVREYWYGFRVALAAIP